MLAFPAAFSQECSLYVAGFHSWYSRMPQKQITYKNQQHSFGESFQSATTSHPVAAHCRFTSAGASGIDTNWEYTQRLGFCVCVCVRVGVSSHVPTVMEGEREDLTGSIQNDGKRLDPVRVGVWWHEGNIRRRHFTINIFLICALLLTRKKSLQNEQHIIKSSSGSYCSLSWVCITVQFISSQSSH